LRVEVMTRFTDGNHRNDNSFVGFFTPIEH
jgi:hypothetical protein